MGSMAFLSIITNRTMRTMAAMIMAIVSMLAHPNSVPPNSKSRMTSRSRRVRTAIPL